MAVDQMEQDLKACAEEVLESMFFTSPLSEPVPGGRSRLDLILAQVTFRGTASGRFGVGCSMDAARSLTAAFLGMESDTVAEQQCGEVICELANMLCGSVLSRMEPGGRFDLMTPEIEPPGCLPETVTASRIFQLEEGALLTWLLFEEANWIEIGKSKF